VTAIKQQIEIGNGTTEEFLVTELVEHLFPVNKCSTEMVQTGVEGSATNVSQWQVLALRG
jgi:hypothetical protein